MNEAGFGPLFMSALVGAAFVWCVRWWLGSLKEARVSEDTATSRIHSAAQGYVELQGVARPLDEGPLTSPMLGLRAVWWKSTYRRGGKRKMVHERTSTKRFFLEDASGRCLVDPAGAQVTSGTTRTWYADQPGPPDPGAPSSMAGKAYICTETILAPGTHVYVRGEFRTLRAGAQALDLMRDKLAAWQSDEKKRAILDVDRDGKLSETELEAARRAALLDARREAGTAGGTADVVCKPADGRPFVISDVRQQVHTGVHRRSAVLGLIGTIATGVMLIVLLVLAFQP